MSNIKDRHIYNVNDDDWESFTELRKKYNLSWKDVFNRFRIYSNGIEYIFSAPGEMTKQLRLDLNTIMGLMSKWLTNIKDNWEVIHKYPDIIGLKNNHIGKKAVVIAAGPSLESKGHLNILKSKKSSLIVYTTLHSLIPTLKAGIIPKYTGIVDASELMVGFVDDPIVEKHADKITLICCASTHPEIFKKWPGKKIYFFRSGVPQNLLPNVDTFLSILLPHLTEVETGGNSGTSMYNLATFMGCNPIGLVGMDFGYPKGFPYDKTMYYHAYAGSIGTEYADAQDMISKCYEDVHHPVFNTDAYADFVYQVFAKSLYELVKYNKSVLPNHKLVNCTEGGCIHDDNIDCMRFEEFLRL